MSCSAGSVGSRGAPNRWEPPANPIGSAGAPRRPFVVRDLPSGWRVVNRQPSSRRELAEKQRVVVRQSLYLPTGSSPTQGPALLVGYSGESEWSVLECDPPKAIGALNPGELTPAHWGDGLSAIQSTHHPDEIDTEGVGYVVGRGVGDATLASVARSVRWNGDDDAAGLPPRVEVPPGFRLVGTGGLAAHGASLFREEQLRGPQDPASDLFTISQEEDNDAALSVARFWMSATAGQSCGGFSRIAEATLIRDNIVIRAIGRSNPRVREAMRVVLRNLIRRPSS